MGVAKMEFSQAKMQEGRCNRLATNIAFPLPTTCLLP